MMSRAIAGAVFGAFFLSGMISAQAAPPPYKAPEETSVLAPGPNVDVAQVYCGACHSYEYILTQPRGQGFGRDFWQAEVTKMIKVYGAQINEKDASAIVDYLAAAYKDNGTQVSGRVGVNESPPRPGEGRDGIAKR